MRAPGDDRDSWISLLDAAASNPPDELNDEWKWLLEQLGLPTSFFPAVLEALTQGRWRQAKNPRAYLKTVARREAVKMGLTSDGPDEFITLTNNDIDTVSYVRGVSEPIKGQDGIWRPGGGLDRDYDDPREEFGSYRDFLLSGVPKELRIAQPPSESLRRTVDEFNSRSSEHHVHLESTVRPNWSQWAEKAGLTEWERAVLSYRLQGISREKALSDQKTDADRHALQAAWKKFDRTGKDRLRETAKKISGKDVPD
jgi:hypothetical protein